jgi:predicted TIM-barrel fold metal-dependent hydrolase
MIPSKVRRRLMARCSCCGPTSADSAFTGGSTLERRGFLSGGGALGVAAMASLTAAPVVRAQPAPAARTRIDVHHHFIPPFHSDVMAVRRSGGRPPRWSPQSSLEDMDRNGIATAVLSLVQPGAWFPDDVPLSRQLAYQCNEFGARLVQDHPGRFGLFAVISPPDLEGSLKEIERALDVLKADGIGLMTSYGTMYLGDPSFEPVYAELNRRKALVYVHPTTPACCGSILPGIGPSTVEFATDTTRTVTHIVFSGVATRFPDIRWIFSHSGGTLPFLTGRLVELQQVKKDPRLPDGPLPVLRRFYYELAQGHTAGQIAALLKMAPISQVLYGTDFPIRRGVEVNEGIAAYSFDPDELRAIERETALQLIPRLKGA